MKQSDGRTTLLLALSCAGLLFAGYLSSVRFFTDTCAFSEPCPYFLGYPACYYGFAMYALMTLVMVLFYFGVLSRKYMLVKMGVAAAVGILFAGYITLKELPELYVNGMSAYLLGLPTCAYGLLVYVAIFIITFLAMKQVRSTRSIP